MWFLFFMSINLVYHMIVRVFYLGRHSLFYSVVSASLLSILLLGCSAPREAGSENNDDRNVITGEEAIESNAIDISDLIAKKVPGITITETGDGRIITRIRGRNSFHGPDIPLYVVDGLPTEPGRDGSLPGVFITEIEWIKVLKGPAETARWGMRGANGVIEVKTKSGPTN